MKKRDHSGNEGDRVRKSGRLILVREEGEREIQEEEKDGG